MYVRIEFGEAFIVKSDPPLRYAKQGFGELIHAGASIMTVCAAKVAARTGQFRTVRIVA